MRPAEQSPPDERGFAVESGRLLVGDGVLVGRDGFDEIAARLVHLPDRQQCVPNTAQVVRIAASQLERTLGVGLGEVELTEPDEEMRKVGVEAGDEAASSSAVKSADFLSRTAR